MNYKRTKAGDLMHMHECTENGVTYGVIAIRLKDSYTNLPDAERLLLAFMKQLQRSFAIEHTTGLHMETFLQNHRTAITDYWQDAESKDWKVKGWTDGTAMAVLYIKNIGLAPIAKEESFLNETFLVQV
jgi:hypothetical protein